MPQSSPSKVLTDTAVRFLSFRPRFKAEVENKLLLKAKEINADPTLINQIIESLEKSGYINDDDLIESYIRHRLVERGRGPFWLKKRLHLLGLSRSFIECAIQKHASETLQTKVVREILRKKYGLKKFDVSTKSKAIRFLLSRGFSLEIIRQAV